MHYLGHLSAGDGWVGKTKILVITEVKSPRWLWVSADVEKSELWHVRGCRTCYMLSVWDSIVLDFIAWDLRCACRDPDVPDMLSIHPSRSSISGSGRYQQHW